jgi:ATP phosphoribosyltransferase
MAEKDVAIQVSVGNYDIGFCGLDWTKELIDKYRGSNLHIFKYMGIDRRKLFVCSGLSSRFNSITELNNHQAFITIISEYPNLSERFAMKNRLKKFKIFSAWGSVEAYPPEHGDIVILSSYEKDSLGEMGLVPISCELESQLCLLVNRTSFVEKNLSPVLDYFSGINSSGEEK